VIYLLVVSVTIGVMDGGILSASMSPLTDASKGFFRNSEANPGPYPYGGRRLLSFFTTANAGILSASRVPMAMSRDGLLPPCFGSVSRRGTPALSILATAAFMIIIIVALDIAGLAKVASLFLLLVFFLENLGLIVIRFSKLSNYRPLFRSPSFPLFQVLGLVV
jgi:amino acid transporter